MRRMFVDSGRRRSKQPESFFDVVNVVVIIVVNKNNESLSAAVLFEKLRRKLFQNNRETQKRFVSSFAAIFDVNFFSKIFAVNIGGFTPFHFRKIRRLTFLRILRFL